MTIEEDLAFKKQLANFILNDYKGILNKYKLTIHNTPLAPETVGFLCKGVVLGWWDKKFLKETAERWLLENLLARNNKELGYEE